MWNSRWGKFTVPPSVLGFFRVKCQWMNVQLVWYLMWRGQVLVLREWCHICHINCFTYVTSPLSSGCSTIIPQLYSDFSSLCIQNHAILMCSFYGTKTVEQQRGGWRELRDSQMVYGVRNLLQKTAIERYVDIFGIMILKLICNK
jgi:hypothetical protein